MMKDYLQPSLLGLLLCGLLLAGCDLFGADSGPELVKGPEAQIEGGGTAYAFTRFGGGGRPNAIGVALSKAGYESLTDTSDAHRKDGPTAKHDGPASITLALPDEAPAPYDHATIDWWPEGHPPPNVYTVPHFDAHFYFISKQKRESIEPGPAQTFPDERFVPDSYVADSVNVPGDGMHYLNTQAPEFNGKPFTHTFIYGFYRGKSTFIEPMASTEFLSSEPNVTAPVPQPEAYQKAGMYPERYRVTFDAEAQEYRIVLTNLVRHQGAS